MAFINVNIPTSSDIRAEQHLHATEKERDFWLKKAEELQRQLEGIVEAADEHGYVDLYHRDQKVTLYTSEKAAELAETGMLDHQSGAREPMKPNDMLAVIHDKERRALKALMRIYGDDVSLILNGLHAMSARLAIASGVSPEDFTAGVKYHWDFLAEALNEVGRKNKPK